MTGPLRAAQPSDRELVDAVLSGDREAYRALVERESRSVIAVCTQILRDSDEAQDAAQDVFVAAYRSLATYRGEGTFGAWIGRIASRTAIARAMATKRRGSTPLPVDGMIETQNEANPERRMMDRENAGALRQAISELPADQREVVTLRFYNDMPLEGIAAATGTPLGTVKSRLHRALSRLRDHSDLRQAS